MKNRKDATEVFADLIDRTDRAALAVKLTYFTRRYLEERGVDPSDCPRTPEEYVDLGAGDVKAIGVPRSGLPVTSLFVLLATAVAARVDRDLETPLPPHQPKSFRRLSH